LRRDNYVTKYIVFELNDELFGIDIAHVIEIVQMQEVFKVPNTPSYIEGLINLRGKVYTLLNIKNKLNLPEKKQDSEAMKILIINSESDSFGFMADSVNEIVEVNDDDEIQPPPESVSHIDKVYLQGVLNIGNQPVLLFDLEALLNACREKKPSK